MFQLIKQRQILILDLGGQICSTVENTSAIFIEMEAVTLRNDNAFIAAVCLQFKVNSRFRQTSSSNNRVQLFVLTFVLQNNSIMYLLVYSQSNHFQLTCSN